MNDPSLADSIAYPPAPWALAGDALFATRTVAISRIRSLVPTPLRIVPVAPGRTLAVLAFLRYAEGSTLRYHEFICAPALVAKRTHVGSWISHIHVDSIASLAGGRALWNLPKRMASFLWSRDSIEMESPEILCRLEAGSQGGPALPLPLLAPAFGTYRDAVSWFVATGRGRISRVAARLHVNSAELQELGFQQIRHVYRISNLRGTIYPSKALARDAGT